MASREPVGGALIAVPVIVCLAWAMAAQSIEVRRGHSPPQASGETDVKSLAARIESPAEAVRLASAGSTNFAPEAALAPRWMRPVGERP